jgi:hypothetical protein
MSRDASIALDWADGTHQFRLAWAEIAELQEKCNAGPYEILQRLTTGRWRIEEISNVIRLGLIGGGMEPIPALKLVRAYVEARPPFENLMHAQAIMSAGLMGAPDEDDVKKNSEAKAKESTTSPMENFA